MQKDHSQLRIIVVSLAIAFSLSCVSTAIAQSGRRVQKSAPPSAPLPEASPETVAKTDLPKPVLKVVLGMEKYDGFTSISLNTYSGVLRSCAEQLDKPLAVKVELAQRPMLRSEAIDRARREPGTYVVWLQVRADQMSSSTTGTPNNAYIEYSVFAPTTAKLVKSGSTYPRAYRKRGVINPRTSGVDGDQAFNEAARAAADQVLAALRLHLPPQIF